LDPVAQRKLSENASDVGFDGCLGYEQVGGDLGVGAAAGDQAQDADLAFGEVFEAIGHAGACRR
jgi:hypothetical protein